MKKVLAILLGLGILAFGTAFLLVLQKRQALKADHLHRTEELRALAEISAERAGAILHSGSYDLKIVLSSSFLESLLDHLKGFETVTRKGNLLVVKDAVTRLDHGSLRLEVNADVVLKFYKGPVKATYEVFTHLLDDGRCQLELRVVQALAQDLYLLDPHWLEPWLLERMQDKLKIPEITLPLGLSRRLTLPKIEKTIQSNGLLVTVPSRDVTISAGNPYVLVSPEGLILLIGSLDEGEKSSSVPEDPQLAQPTTHSLDIADGVSVSIRFQFIADLIEHLLEPDKDVLLSADLISKVWFKEKKILGVTTRNYADIRDLTGYLDVTKSQMSVVENGLLMDIAVTGEIDGRLEGKAYGIKVKSPFGVKPTVEEELPIGIIHRESDLYIFWPSKEVDLNLDINLKLSKYRIGFIHRLQLNIEDILSPVSLPHWFRKEVEIPTRVERRKVVASKVAPLELDWQMALPNDLQGYLEFSGKISLPPSHSD